MIGIPSHSASVWPCGSSFEVTSEVAVSGNDMLVGAVVTASAGMAASVGVGTTVATGGIDSEQAASASNSKVAMTEGFFIGPSFSNLVKIITECSDGLNRRKGLHRTPSTGS